MNEIGLFFKSAARAIFLLPIGLVIFFAFAPEWQSYKIRSTIRENVSKVQSLDAESSQKLLVQIENANFSLICDSVDSQEANFRQTLRESGYCSKFENYKLGFWFSLLALAIIVVVLTVTQVLAWQAEKSNTKLLTNFKWAWRLNLANAIFQLLIQTPLLAFAMYEFTVLLANRYFPQLIGIVLLAAVFAIYKCLKVIFIKVPLQFEEGNSLLIQRDQSPEMWAAIDAAADKMQTHRVDNVVIGMSENFYVTEMQLQTPFGLIAGRTLYLSHPMLQSLNVDEVMAIVNHELAHFKGEDTKMTRDFFPFLFKVNRTIEGLAEAGFAALVVNSMLQVFLVRFKVVQQLYSRQRELLADRRSAEMVSAPLMAQALIKVSVFSQTYSKYLSHMSLTALESQNNSGGVMAAYRGLNHFFKENVLEIKEFWLDLAEVKSAHPFDSHPPLRDRIENLGFPVQNVNLKTFANYEDQNSCLQTWFSPSTSLFDEMQNIWNRDLLALGVQQKVLNADVNTNEGHAILQAEFPEVVWKAKPQRFWKVASAFLFIGFLLFGFSVLAKAPIYAKVLLSLGGFFVFYIFYFYYRNHWQGEIRLNHLGLTYSGFKKRVVFEEVIDISAQVINGTSSILFKLKEKQLSYLKFTIFNRNLDIVQLEIQDFSQKPEIIFEKIVRYFNRLK